MQHFIHTQKQKQLFMKVILMTYLNQSVLQLYQKYNNLQKKVQDGLLTQLQSIILIIPSKYNPLADSSYIKLTKELHHPRKGMINIQNIDDNEQFKQLIACSYGCKLIYVDDKLVSLTQAGEDVV